MLGKSLRLNYFLMQEELQNWSSSTGEKGDDLIRVLRELTSVQRKIADLQVELQGRKVSYWSLSYFLLYSLLFLGLFM